MSWNSFCNHHWPANELLYLLIISWISYWLLFFFFLFFNLFFFYLFWYSYLPLGWVRTLCWFYLLFASSQPSLEGFPSHPVIKSQLNLPTAQQANKTKRWGVEARNVALFREPADQEDGRIMCLNNHLIGVWMPVSFIELRGKGSEAIKQKGHLLNSHEFV